MWLSLLLRAAPYLAAVAAVIGLGTYVHHHGVESGRAEVQARFDLHLRQDAEAIAAENAKDRAKEEATQAAFARVDQQHQETLKNAQAEYEKIIASLKSGAVRVRDNRAAVCRSEASPTPASPGSDQPGARSQLSEPDAEFLLSIGREADQVVTQLQACQALLKAERSGQEIDDHAD
jgi:hypothetical protein